MNDIEIALTSEVTDDALIRHFLAVWPVISSILEAFSKATRLPIFAYLNRTQVFQSSMETMPPFCAAMLGSREMAIRCVHDGQRRALREEAEVVEGIQFCHAGMINGRCAIETGCVGSLVILYGSRKSIEPEAQSRREKVKSLALERDKTLASSLQKADIADGDYGDIAASDSSLMKAIAVIIEKLIGATVGFRSLTINMAHELTLVMVGMGLLAKELETSLGSYREPAPSDFSEIRSVQAHILSESQLGLYVIRNFLSHASETRYKQLTNPRFSTIDIGDLILEMLDLYRLQLASKELSFDCSGLDQAPKIVGLEQELRRLLHNIISNAIKYSYRSIPESKRVIRIKAKVPYDPGFRQRRFAISFENYGIGLQDDEIYRVLRPGFRGRQALAEVPIGAGIGLSESHKIMQIHGGDIRLKSKRLHQSDEKGATFLTTVDLIFPY